MRVLLIGATGLIGSAAAARLHGEGHALVAVARALGPPTRRLPVDRCQGGGRVRTVPRRAKSPPVRWWFAFGFPAFTALLAIFWLMITRPEILI